MNHKSHPLITSILLFIGAGVTLMFGTWMFISKPLRPTVQTVTVENVIEKPVPCPITQQKNGPATARGGRDAYAHSGNGDTFNSSPPQKPPTNSPHD